MIDMKYIIQSVNPTDPYASLITDFIVSEFTIYSKEYQGSKLDLVSDAIMSTGQVRYGPRPSPESQVAIREVIMAHMQAGTPIPFLVPWGSKKPNGTGIDVAELMAYKTMQCIRDRVVKYHIPGAEFFIRVEDASAPYLYYDNPNIREEVKLYTDGMMNLAMVTAADAYIHVRPESMTVSEQQLTEQADVILPFMQAHIATPSDSKSIAALAQFGWTMPVTMETIAFYLRQYDKMYRGEDRNAHLNRMARYFTKTAARNKLGASGVQRKWNGKFLELSFLEPTPGISRERSLRRLFYRTMPENITKNHMPPWRAKGYIQVDETSAKAKLAHFTDNMPWNPYEIVLKNGDTQQTIQADYVVV